MAAILSRADRLKNWDLIGSRDNLSPVQHQTTTWANADLFSIRSTSTKFSEL